MRSLLAWGCIGDAYTVSSENSCNQWYNKQCYVAGLPGFRKRQSTSSLSYEVLRKSCGGEGTNSRRDGLQCPETESETALTCCLFSSTAKHLLWHFQEGAGRFQQLDNSNFIAWMRDEAQTEIVSTKVTSPQSA
ncbi:hypothetical protein WJX84_003985 [Apatococcus fuscideae]|uniref:Uncharacterized protein n=1 Tax=Apatococcus fuscideae TaxID=2026836 RepID=A0AAW1SU27_9CHLO